jgi:hypothetical protein
VKVSRFPVFDGNGNVFDWILVEAKKLRKVRHQENRNAAKAARESKKVELRKLAHEERKAVDARAKGDGRALPT